MNPWSSLRCTIVLGALVLATATAGADQTRLAWTDCAGGSGTSVASFACNSNAGQHVLVASFILDQPFSSEGRWGVDAEVYFSTGGGYYGTPVSDWWRSQSGGCRQDVVQVSTDFSGLPPSTCNDPYLPLSGSEFTVVDTPDLPPHGGAHYARLRAVVASDDPVELASGAEYLAFRVILPHTKTIGTGACAGCCEAMYMWIESFMLLGTPADGDRSLQKSGTIQWQGSIGCGPTKSTRTTWGQVRALYR